MSMYSFLRPVLFALDAEKSHNLALRLLATSSNYEWCCKALEAIYAKKLPSMPVRCMGLDFSHPLGLAAGLDKDAQAAPALSALGFSGVELGTVTPMFQAGNNKPRLFRLTEDSAIINRMGFNSQGVDVFLDNIQRPKNTVVGVNVGKNAITPIENAAEDYLSAMQRVYGVADYITINISSPNTQSLRDLQNASALDALLGKIMLLRKKCQQVHQKKVPVAIKVAPDLTSEEVGVIAELLLSHQVDGLIASNTTITRPDSLHSQYRNEQGGLSGAPVKQLSTDCIAEFYRHLGGKVSIIGVGGIQNAEDAWQKLCAGADYLQVYSQFIYDGPVLLRRILYDIREKVRCAGFSTLGEALLHYRK